MKRIMKKGQMQISFGMIFSIVLVIFFLGFAFYAIKIFLGTTESAKAGKLINDLQGDIDRIWNSQTSSEQREYSVPSYVDLLCIVDFGGSGALGENSQLYQELMLAGDETENLVLYPIKNNGFESIELKHVNLKATTAEENPVCIASSGGKIHIGLSKNLGDSLVTIEKIE